MLTTIKSYACYAVEIYKNKPQLSFFQKGGGGGAGPGSAFHGDSLFDHFKQNSVLETKLSKTFPPPQTP